MGTIKHNITFLDQAGEVTGFFGVIEIDHDENDQPEHDIEKIISCLKNCA